VLIYISLSCLQQYTGAHDDGHFAIVANCGDSRLLVESDVDRGHRQELTIPMFRQVTKDHRVVDDAEDTEVMRLVAANAVVNNHRIYPGGLAVSRTIGDVAYASAVIATPDVVLLDLMPQLIQPNSCPTASYADQSTGDQAPTDSRKEEDRTTTTATTSTTTATRHRFILATDGLWDSLQFAVHGNQKSKSSVASISVQRAVGKMASRRFYPDPKVAATNLMKECLLKVGCFDDITILVVDVTEATATAPRIVVVWFSLRIEFCKL
jgi:serine/threonine protein phosphatase PrpC